MPELILNGPVVRKGIHNLVLRDVSFHSPISRGTDYDNYCVISVGIREGEYTSWIGEWDQSDQEVEAAIPVSMLDSGRHGMRLKEKQAMVVKVETAGTPETLEGARVDFVRARVGGRTGSAKPLVASGSEVTDANSRVALSALERQINSGGLSEWDEGVQLHDPVPQVAAGTFQGRLQWDSATQISIQQYTGNWIEIDGVSVPISTSGLTCLNTDGVLSSSGGVSNTGPTTKTLYYVYVADASLRLSTASPTYHNGVLYLGTGIQTRLWRFVGWVYTDAATEFSDSETAREVVNYYNRIVSRLYTCPDYLDDNAPTPYLENSVTWVKANAGTGSDVSFIANSEDLVRLSVTYYAMLDKVGVHGPAIGIDGITDIETAGNCMQTMSERVHITVPRIYAPSTVGRHTASLLVRVSGGTATIYADYNRNGAVSDPAQTFLCGWVMT